MPLLTLVAVLALGQARPYEAYDLPLSVRPVSLPPVLRGKPILSVSQYKGTSKSKIVRVFRTSYPTNYQAELTRLSRALPASQGWKVEKLGGGYTSITRKASGGLTQQSLLLLEAKLVRDTKLPSFTRRAMVPRWIAVSYNEEYAKAPGLPAGSKRDPRALK